MIPWIPILTAGATLLGSLVGNQSQTNQKENTATTTTGGSSNTSLMDAKTKDTQTQTQSEKTDSVTSSIDKAIQNAIQTTTQVGSETAKAQTNQAQTNTSTESGVATDAQQTAESTLSNQTQQVSRLDETTLDQLTTAVRAGISNNAAAASKNRLDQVSGTDEMFDVDSYVDGVMGGARADVASDLESAGNQIQSRTGASSRSNSAAALLKAKINQQGAARLGALEADTIAKGTQIKQSLQESKTGQITQLASQTDSSAAQMLGALLQARESGTTAASGTSSGTSTGIQNTQQTGSGTQNVATDSLSKTDSSQSGTSKTNTVTDQTNKTNQTQNTLTSMQSILDSISQQKQTDKSASTEVGTTISGITKKTGETNWGDLFTNIGKVLSTTF